MLEPWPLRLQLKVTVTQGRYIDGCRLGLRGMIRKRGGTPEGTSSLTISEEGMFFFPVIYLLCGGVPLLRALSEEIS